MYNIIKNLNIANKFICNKNVFLNLFLLGSIISVCNCSPTGARKNVVIIDVDAKKCVYIDEKKFSKTKHALTKCGFQSANKVFTATQRNFVYKINQNGKYIAINASKFKDRHLNLIPEEEKSDSGSGSDIKTSSEKPIIGNNNNDVDNKIYTKKVKLKQYEVCSDNNSINSYRVTDIGHHYPIDVSTTNNFHPFTIKNFNQIKKLRFTQTQCSTTDSDGYNVITNAKKLAGEDNNTKNALMRNPINIYSCRDQNGNISLWSVDNRRLAAFKMAGLDSFIVKFCGDYDIHCSEWDKGKFQGKMSSNNNHLHINLNFDGGTMNGGKRLYKGSKLAKFGNHTSFNKI